MLGTKHRACHPRIPIGQNHGLPRRKQASFEELYHTLDLINDAQAEKTYKDGMYYKHIGKVASAEFYLGKIPQRWPNSPWAVKAKTELAHLAKLPRKPSKPSKIIIPPGFTDPFSGGWHGWHGHGRHGHGRHGYGRHGHGWHGNVVCVRMYSGMSGPRRPLRQGDRSRFRVVAAHSGPFEGLSPMQPFQARLASTEQELDAAPRPGPRGDRVYCVCWRWPRSSPWPGVRTRSAIPSAAPKKTVSSAGTSTPRSIRPRSRPSPSSSSRRLPPRSANAAH